MTPVPTIKSTRPKAQVITEHRPTAAQIEDAIRRAMMPARDLTGLILGDPPVGRSALDEKQKQRGE